MNMMFKPDPTTQEAFLHESVNQGIISGYIKCRFGLPPFGILTEPFYRRFSNYLLGDKFFDPEGVAAMEEEQSRKYQQVLYEALITTTRAPEETTTTEPPSNHSPISV